MCVEWSNLSRDGRKVFSKIYHPTLLMLHTQKLESFEKIGCHFPHWHWGGERYPDSSVDWSVETIKQDKFNYLVDNDLSVIQNSEIPLWNNCAILWSLIINKNIGVIG